MATMSEKVKTWIEQKRDPRSAHWQAGLESVLELFRPGLERGRIVPVRAMEDREIPLFKSALAKVAVSPSNFAAFLPKTVADAIVPPETAEETYRIEKANPSCKLIVLQPGKEDRILCAEISELAFKPGIDIFQSGALLGSYDYETSDDCLEGLNKTIKAHAWKKDSWQREDFQTYTLNWFERVQFLSSAQVYVDENFSFFHSPTLIRTQRVDALFHLFFLLLKQQYAATGFLEENPLLAQKIGEKDSEFCRTMARNHILDLLNLVKDLKLMDFAEFSDGENKAFHTEYARTEERLRDLLIHLKR